MKALAAGTPVDVYVAPALLAKPVEDLLPLLRKLPRAVTATEASH
jgi:hypothetical protein